MNALLNLDGGVKPEMVATDNASMVFGIFKMLGYRFSPRFKDMEDQRFWKAQMTGAETTGGYGPLEAQARNKVTVKGDHRVAGHAGGGRLPGHQQG